MLLLFSILLVTVTVLLTRPTRLSYSTVPGPLLTPLNKLLIGSVFLFKSVPEASNYFLKKYLNPSSLESTVGEGSHRGQTSCKVVRIWLNGREVFIISDKRWARHVMFKNPNNYIARWGDDKGLQILGMKHQGIIWNDHLAGWKRQRSFFHEGLKSHRLILGAKEGHRLASVFVERVTREFHAKGNADGFPGVEVDMLSEIRKMTLGVTLRIMFGVKECRGFSEDEVLEAIVNYFKAWEFFLLRPPQAYILTPQKYFLHRRSIARLNDCVRALVQQCIEGIDKKDSTNSQLEHEEQTGAFFHSLYEAYLAKEVTLEQLHQCVLEMLLAGTDTSSVSLYYTLVCISASKTVENNMVKEIDEVMKGQPDFKGEGYSNRQLESLEYMKLVLWEAMRIKPVGPVIMRKALQEDTMPDGHLIPAGAGVIVHLAAMNMDDSHWKDPLLFDPERMRTVGSDDFFPFGKGKKSCAGSDLAMMEMKAILAQLLARLRFFSPEEINEMQTHWDVANQPVRPGIMFVKPRVKEIESSPQQQRHQ